MFVAADGRQRSKRFGTEEAATGYDAARAEVSRGARRSNTVKFGRSGGVYSHTTREGVRWRFVYRGSDGAQTSNGEVRHTKETFGAYWHRRLAQLRPYVEAGTWTGPRLDEIPRYLDACSESFARWPSTDRQRAPRLGSPLLRIDYLELGGAGHHPIRTMPG